MGGTQDLDIHRSGFCQDILHLLAVLADDVAVIASCIREPVLLKVHLVGKEIAVKRAEAAEGIRGKQRAGNRVIGHHDLGPVDHRRHDKGQRMPADVQGVAFPNQNAAVGNIAGKKLVQDQRGRQRADHLGVRIAHQHLGNGGAVVRLHVVHNEIVQISPVQHRREVFKELTGHRAVHRVHQNRLFVQDHIGVVRHAAWDGIHVLKQLDTAVAHADVGNVVRHHAAAADPGKFLFAVKRQTCFFPFLGKGRHAPQCAGGHKARRPGGRSFQEVSSRDFFAHTIAPFLMFIVEACMCIPVYLIVKNKAIPLFDFAPTVPSSGAARPLTPSRPASKKRHQRCCLRVRCVSDASPIPFLLSSAVSYLRPLWAARSVLLQTAPPSVHRSGAGSARFSA